MIFAKRSVLFHIVICVLTIHSSNSLAQTKSSGREHLKMDFGWKFSFGHPYDPKKDFNTGTGYFSYITKAGYGDGAAAANFDDRAWRTLDIPHDWAVEAPFDSKGSHSHGYKAIGRNFTEASVGWYRKTFQIPASDLGRKIYIQFDGVSRNSMVWVNGHYLGTEPSGYQSFEYDITDILNYGGNNVVAVRCDVTMEEGWFYEGAGIYRHVWLKKMEQLHVAQYGTFVSSEVNNNTADVTARVTIVNNEKEAATFSIIQTIYNAEGKKVGSSSMNQLQLQSLETKEFSSIIPVADPKLWSIESPYLHKLITTIQKGDAIVDSYETTFGIRTIRFDANQGFFLNGKHVKLKGTNNHQDHAGVGTAIPDALQEFRIATLKSLGSNAYRCSHNPPTPELLDACDRLGMLVIDENRLMGSTAQALNEMKRMIIRDRNHPCIITWSIGNEEWAIEGNITGARIASSMQRYAKTIDPTRPINAAVSGAWGGGISSVIEIMGYNYIAHGSTDDHHKKFPEQPSIGTEEGSTFATRGVYVDDKQKQYIAAYDKKPRPGFYSIEEGWNHYATRDYLSGMFIWTGFDYRGESTPYGFPSVVSYFGMLDLCGFEKDNAYYLRSWWGDKPILHILPHWNWMGKEGEEIDVRVYSNCEEVELFLNKRSLGKKKMPVNSHLQWQVKYNPGTLEAVGYKGGKKILTTSVKTTSEPVAIHLTPHKQIIEANRDDVSVITIQVKDKNNIFVPTANSKISFSIEGPGKIIGVGNGDQTSHEVDRFIETIHRIEIKNIKEKNIEKLTGNPETEPDYDDSGWDEAFKDENESRRNNAKAVVFRGNVELPENFKQGIVTWFFKTIATEQSIYVNGHLIAKDPKDDIAEGYKIDPVILRPGKNTVAIVGIPLKKKYDWDVLNKEPGVFQVIYPPSAWNRKIFNGLAQILIQATNEPGEIVLKATGDGLKEGIIKIKAIEPNSKNPFVP